MNKRESIFIKDFVLSSGIEEKNYSPTNFDKVVINNKSILSYKKSCSYSHCTLVHSHGKFEIQWNNSFYPLFHYKINSCEIVTPNYSHLFNLRLPLSVDQNLIREFILFNTTLQNKTLHNEVERLIGIEKIVFESFGAIFYYKNSETSEILLKDLFIEKIDSQSDLFEEYKHGIFLSGGSESRINAAIAQAYNFNKEFITWGHPQDKEYLIASQIAKRLNTKIINIRPINSDLPYNELLEKTGFLVNMQYAYRYAAVKQLVEQFDYDVIWTGWGDINGYPTMYQPSELFSDYYLGLYHGINRYPVGWNREWLSDFTQHEKYVLEKIKVNPDKRTFFELKDNLFAPHIFGQVLSIENTLGYVLAPWFQPDIYAAIQYEENENKRIVNNKLWRTIWKNDLYYQLIKKYCHELNYIENSKGYFPWLVRKRFGFAGLFLAAGFKKFNFRKKYPFDAVEDRHFIKTELDKIVSDRIYIFEKNDIYKIIKNIEYWNGVDILEYFKIIQINWLLKKNYNN